MRLRKNIIFGLCIRIMTITDEDIAEMRELIREQKEYINPLKPATTGWQRELAEHNEKVLEKLLELKTVIEEGQNIKEPE